MRTLLSLLPCSAAAATAKIAVPGNSRTNPRNIIDGEDPTASVDPAAYFDWWPTNGGVGVPASRRLPYRDGAAWKAVEAVAPYAVERNRYHRAAFRPVTTTAVRLELQARPNVSIGIQEWKVK
jgi:hypothetical protein